MTERRQPPQPWEISPAILLTVSPAARQHLPTKCSICGKYLAEPPWPRSASAVQVWRASSSADLHADVNSKHQRVWQHKTGSPECSPLRTLWVIVWLGENGEIIRWLDSDCVNTIFTPCFNTQSPQWEDTPTLHAITLLAELKNNPNGRFESLPSKEPW